MKSVLISIRPEWCAKIASGEKTIEVRKTAPKIATPFRCYIYCSKKKKRDEYGSLIFYKDDNGIRLENGEGVSPLVTGKVIGEFVCDFIPWYISELWDDETFERIQEILEPEDFAEYGEYEYKTIADNSDDFWKDNMLCKASCVSIEDLRKYIGTGINEFYGWHISDLKIYDEPKKLSEFKPWRRDCYYNDLGLAIPECQECRMCKIERPPQSWCYVED